MNKVKLINDLIAQVELSIYDLQWQAVHDKPRTGVPIQPLKEWKNQEAVESWKAMLRKRFGAAVQENSLDKDFE